MDDAHNFSDMAAPASKILKANDFEALARARHGIEQAQMEAQTILARAQEEAESIRAVAREEGRADAAALVAEYLLLMQHDIGASHETLVKVVMTALRRVLKPIPPAKVVTGAVARALEEADVGRGATLIVAPSLMHLLRDHLAERGIASATLEVRGDPDCPVESSILRSEFGDIELGVEFQLRAIERGLRAAEDAGQ